MINCNHHLQPSLDPSNLNSYHPISNLIFISKTLERLIDARLTKHEDKHSLFPINHSAYRKYHSTETAVVRIYNDLSNAIDLGHVGALVLSDLLSAFDTVDHQVMLNVLHRRFGVSDTDLDWFRSYFEERTQVFSAVSEVSAVRSLTCSVPRGSVLGPKSWIAYCEDTYCLMTVVCVITFCRRHARLPSC